MDGKTRQLLKESLVARWKMMGKGSPVTPDDESASDINPPQAEIIDIAQAVEQIGRESSLAEQERRELLAIERALSKMSTGNFGICEECGDEIPARRLMVLPEARLCASCQAVAERESGRMRSSA